MLWHGGCTQDWSQIYLAARTFTVCRWVSLQKNIKARDRTCSATPNHKGVNAAHHDAGAPVSSLPAIVRGRQASTVNGEYAAATRNRDERLVKTRAKGGVGGGKGHCNCELP